MLHIQTFEAFEFKKKRKIKKHIKDERGGVVNIMSRISDKKKGNLPELLENVSKRFDVKIIKYQNCGAFGMAFIADNNKVIKLTSEKSEAANVKALIGKRVPGCLDYYDIVYSRKYDIYCILMERVQILSKKEELLYNAVLDAFDYVTKPREIYYVNFVLDALDGEFTRDEIKKAVNLVTDLKRKLQSAGVDTRDLHTGNMGWRGKELVHFDIMSDATKQDDIDKISKIKKGR